MTAIFDKDGCGAVPLRLRGRMTTQPRQIAAVQALVDTGMSVKEAMAAFKTGPPKQGPPTEPIHTQLPALVH